MTGHGTKLNRKMDAAIIGLLSCRNIEEAAKQADIGTQTLVRWMKLPEFDRAYREARREAFRQSVARLQQASSAAVTTLLKTMVDPSVAPAVKVRAADCVLSHSTKAIETEDLDARISELERVARESDQE